MSCRLAADSLHLGNLLGIVALAWALSCGHTAVALLGGATARVGDPSGKSVERPVLSEAEIGRNTEGIAAVIEGILGRHAEQQQGQQQVRMGGGDATVRWMRDSRCG